MIYVISGIVAGSIIGMIAYNYFIAGNKKDLLNRAEKIMKEGEVKRETILSDAKKLSEEHSKEFGKECDGVVKILENKKEILRNREMNVQRREDNLNGRARNIDKAKKQIKMDREEFRNSQKKQIEQLLKIVEMKMDVVKEEIVNGLEKDIRGDFDNRLKGRYDALLEEAEQKSENIVKQSLQRYSKKNAIRVTFPPISVTPAFAEKYKEDLDEIQKLTEAEIEYSADDEAIYVNYYNLVRRTAAYETVKALTKQRKGQSKILIKDLVKEKLNKIHKNMENIGRSVVKELNVKGLPDEVVKLVGRLNYRTSFGQNIMLHSLEVAFFAEMLAYEIGADAELTKKAALLHDLGKAIDQEIEGSHDLLTKKIMEKYKMNEDVIHAAYNHHNAEEMKSVEARLVQAADAMSASRPGARMEAGEQYIERVKAIESEALSMKGVQKAYAIQAGREVRTYVDPDKVTDEDLEKMAKDLAGKIEENVQYPGQVMVNMIRELRVTEHAK